MSVPRLAEFLGGQVLFSAVAAVAMATILAVVAGLIFTASTSFAHDFYANVLRPAAATDPKKEIAVARIASVVMASLAIVLTLLLGPGFNAAFIVGPRIFGRRSSQCSGNSSYLFWRRFNTTGACGMVTGLISSLALISVSPSIMGVDGPAVVGNLRHLLQMSPLFPLENPGICTIPLGFAAAVLGTVLTRPEPSSNHFREFSVQATTGIVAYGSKAVAGNSES